MATDSHAYPNPRTRVVLALTISLPLITTGCGLPVGPNHRLLLGYQATTPDASSLRTVIPGLDPSNNRARLSTNPQALAAVSLSENAEAIEPWHLT